MTPEQMLARLTKPLPPRPVAPPLRDIELDELEWLMTGQVAKRLETDFASSSGMNVITCLGRALCPLCGEHMGKETDSINTAIDIFYCDKNNQHVYELDNETGQADRVPM